MYLENSLAFAQSLDAQDELKNFRSLFHIPKTSSGKEVIYFTGNSLGLQPTTAKEAILQELDDWANLGVEGHFHGRNPWFSYHKLLTAPSANLVGAKPVEVVVMNNLTVNLHLLMVSFYRPTSKRFKILMEGGAFPSDQYAVESQVRFHGFDPEQAIVEIFPKANEYYLHTPDIVQKIKDIGEELALVLFGGVNYYTGQAFDMQAITQAAHEVGAVAGFDLAHAAGNIPLRLHEWNVDFATWCTYKYLNSGAGGTSGVFIHEKYADATSLPRFAGWWGHEEKERFLMKKGFKPMRGAEGWQLSNAQILPMAVHRASLQIFEEAGMQRLWNKHLQMQKYIYFLLDEFNQKTNKFNIEVITPRDERQSGCQLSLVIKKIGKQVYEFLTKNGVIVDWREPEVIRIAPVPLYNTFEELYLFFNILSKF
ncbi:kynureninase [Thermoflexibacter ruber]|uniref:Kynureninase n=1 Tax=Thermoflexibacter ruber TaxID=1003 RepID=A0A1I2HKK9_9BACT|nr:kynureninase [Thermoflexibacter ruber]SFF29387.1 Kynureninase [Thermoflexibacter ruber]